MANPSFSMPDEMLQKFDSIRDELKRQGDVGMDASRSAVARVMIDEWIEEQEERLDLEDRYWVDEGNAKMAIAAD